MERLNLHLATAIAANADLDVIGPAGSASHLPDARVHEIPVNPLWRYLLRAAWSSFIVAINHRPRLVVAGSGLTAPFAWGVAKLTRGTSVVYLHGLDVIADHPVYRACWLPFIRKCDQAIANSRNTARLVERAGVRAERITVIHPGVATNGGGIESSVDFRARHHLGEGRLMLSVGRITPRKGLREFIAHALPRIIEKAPDASLVVIGDDAPHALSGRNVGGGRKLMDLAASIGMEGRVKVLGTCDDQTLQAAYQAAAVHVFPIVERPGDVEGFGMVALEAAANGLPTVAFDVGGVSDAVIEGQSGTMIKPGCYDEFADAIVGSMEMEGRAAMAEKCRVAARAFDWVEFDSKLHALLFPNTEPDGRQRGEVT